MKKLVCDICKEEFDGDGQSNDLLLSEYPTLKFHGFQRVGFVINVSVRWDEPGDACSKCVARFMANHLHQKSK